MRGPRTTAFVLPHRVKRKSEPLLRRMLKITLGENMTHVTPDRRSAVQSPKANSETPAFKPVALPALAAAMQAVRFRQQPAKSQELPAILRKEALD
jgi:hypothetical protein